MNKFVVFIAMSLDGYIARSDHDISFLDMVSVPDEDYGYGKLIKAVDTVIMGRKTYDKVSSMGGFPHRDKQTFVMTRLKREDIGNIRFHTGEFSDLLNSLQDRERILIDGGAEIINEVIALDFIDHYTISIIPVLLGGGIRLFDGEWSLQKLKLEKSISFPSGLVQLQYSRTR